MPWQGGRGPPTRRCGTTVLAPWHTLGSAPRARSFTLSLPPSLPLFRKLYRTHFYSRSRSRFPPRLRCSNAGDTRSISISHTADRCPETAIALTSRWKPPATSDDYGCGFFLATGPALSLRLFYPPRHKYLPHMLIGLYLRDGAPSALRLTRGNRFSGRCINCRLARRAKSLLLKFQIFLSREAVTGEK